MSSSQTRAFLNQSIAKIRQSEHEYQQAVRALACAQTSKQIREAVTNWHQKYLEFSRIVRECAFTDRHEYGGVMVSDAAMICASLERAVSKLE